MCNVKNGFNFQIVHTKASTPIEFIARTCSDCVLSYKDVVNHVDVDNKGGSRNYFGKDNVIVTLSSNPPPPPKIFTQFCIQLEQ